MKDDKNNVFNQFAWIMNYQSKIEHQHFHAGNDIEKEKQEAESVTVNEGNERKEELFHFVHPSLGSDEEWAVHNEVKRLVSRHGIQEICQYLTELSDKKKVLLPQSLSVAYKELVRMGMPTDSGFNERTFQKYYKR